LSDIHQLTTVVLGAGATIWVAGVIVLAATDQVRTLAAWRRKQGAQSRRRQ